MIDITNIDNSEPYNIFKNYYDLALKKGQKVIEAISISSYNKTLKEVRSRNVNLKYIRNNEWIFFSNYNSNKAKDFESHDQISALIYWSEINVQISLRAITHKTNYEVSDDHFAQRSNKKNALAISSFQSKKIGSYEDVVSNYEKIYRSNEDLSKRPNYWGGFSFVPYYIEFWEGHASRINKRIAFEFNHNNEWTKYFLQP